MRSQTQRNHHAFSLVLVLAVSSGFGSAQSDPVGRPPAPKIGLVLSGGGARGCAHVGVLQVLEELRIPIHVIAGTSMGSIVGGMYAYGMSPARLVQEMTRAGDRRPWSRLLQDDPHRDARSFRRKEEEFEFLVDFGLGYRDGELRLPKGLLQGQNLDLELRAAVLLAHDLDSFDRLPIPFRAVAVELRTGTEVVMDAGNLAAAMRASMSLPGIFAPAVIDGRELLDGGLVNNIPIDVARRMGATRLIVVDIGTPLSDKAVSSALDVSERTVQLLTQQNVDRSIRMLQRGDVMIRPELGDITTSDFDRAAESIEIGRKAARALAGELGALSVGEAEYRAFLAAQRRDPAPVQIDEIRIENRSGLADTVLRSRLRSEPGKDLDVEELRRDLERIYGLGDFESVTFEVLRSAGQGRVLVVRATDKSWGPTYFKSGLALSSDLQGRSGFQIGGQMNVHEVNGLGAEWRTDLQIGEVNELELEFYQPLDPSGLLFVAPRAVASNAGSDAGVLGSVDVRLAAAGLDLGINLGTSAEIRLRYARITGDVDFDASAGLSGFDFDDGVIEARLLADTQDEARFPRSGIRSVVVWTQANEALGADSEYEKLSAGFVGYLSHGDTTGAFAVTYETTVDGSLPVYRTPSLGGFARLSGLEEGSVTGPHVGFVAGIVRHQIAGSRGGPIGFPVFLGATVEAGDAWMDRGDSFRSFRLAGSVFTAVGTPLGPTYFAYGQAEGGERAFFVFVGQPF